MGLVIALVCSGALLWVRRAQHEAAQGPGPCPAALAAWADDLAIAERRSGDEVVEGVGAPATVVQIAPWDPTRVWGFHRQDGYTAWDGVFQGTDRLDVIHTWLNRPDRPDRPRRDAAARHVYLEREFWDDDPYAPGPQPKRQHCTMAPGYVMWNPLHDSAQATEPTGHPPGSTPGRSVSVTLRPGVRLSVEPGQPTTIDGDPGTAYAWSPAEGPWLRADFVLDQRNQLRSATITDTARNQVLAEMTARPTDARIERPDWTDP
jgi:hypothetical protein